MGLGAGIGMPLGAGMGNGMGLGLPHAAKRGGKHGRSAHIRLQTQLPLNQNHSILFLTLCNLLIVKGLNECIQNELHFK